MIHALLLVLVLVLVLALVLALVVALMTEGRQHRAESRGRRA